VQLSIRFLPARRTVSVPAGTSLLEAARQAGLPVAQSCTAQGVCARCGMQIVEGAEALAAESSEETRAKDRNRIDPALRLSCRLVPDHDLTVTAPYW
jgi:ferredoxin